jgi:hypothetical protein
VVLEKQYPARIYSGCPRRQGGSLICCVHEAEAVEYRICGITPVHRFETALDERPQP